MKQEFIGGAQPVTLHGLLQQAQDVQKSELSLTDKLSSLTDISEQAKTMKSATSHEASLKVLGQIFDIKTSIVNQIDKNFDATISAPSQGLSH